MNINTRQITPKKLGLLKNMLLKSKKDKKPVPDIEDEEQADAVKAFLHHLKYRESTLFTILKKLKFIDEEELGINEQRMKTIAYKNQLDLVVAPEIPSTWGKNLRLNQYIHAAYDGMADEALKNSLKALHVKQNRRITEKLDRINNNAQVVELASKHPNIDIQRLVKYCVLTEKTDYNQDDLEWLNTLIEIIKQGKTVEPRQKHY